MMLRMVILGLTVAACWGSADTLATFVSRHLGTASTTLVAQVAGLVVAAGVALALGLPLLSAREMALSVLFGIVLGVVAALAYLTLYQTLALGPLAITSPLVSGQGGVTLLLAVVLLHESLVGWPLIFLLVTFAGILLSAINGHDVKRLTLRTLLSPGVALALLSMLCFGVFAFGLMQAATATTWLLAVLWSRVFSCLFLGMLLRPPGNASAANAGSHRHVLAWIGAAVVGSLDVGGLLLLAFVGSSGAVGIVGMIASAYGVIPLVCGILVFRERVAVNQMVGVVLLIAGLVGTAAPASPVSLLLLVISGAGLLMLGLGYGIQQWLRHLAARRAARAAEGQAARGQRLQRIVQQLLASEIDGVSAISSPSVLLCGTAAIRPDDPHAQAVEETVRLLTAAEFGILTDEEISFLEMGNPGGDLSSPVNDDTRDGARRVTDAMPQLVPLVAAVRAVVVFPGSLESLANLIEALCAMQTGMVAPTPIILYGSARWQKFLAGIDALLEEAEMPTLIQLCDDPAEIAASVSAISIGTGSPNGSAVSSERSTHNIMCAAPR